LEKRRHVPAWLAEAGHAPAGIFFPPADCRLLRTVCEQLLTRSSPLPICGDCLASFPHTGGDVCGRPLDLIKDPCAKARTELQTPAICLACHSDTFDSDRARSFARCQEGLLRAVVGFGWWRKSGIAPRKLQADVVVPVPPHKDRQREFGFNQAELLSRAPGQTNRPAAPGLLQKSPAG